MGNGSLRFKDNSGNVISFISGSGTDIVISGGTLNLLGMTEVALGNVTISGSTLVNGTQGNQGPQGMNGFQGPTGLQGDTGFQGNQGPTGLQGSQGNQGPTGLQGTNGTVGTQGNQGPTGLQGNQGNQGPTGLQGNQGPNGLQGPTGLQGTTGASAGITGYTNSGDNRILTSVNSTTINAESNLIFDGSILTVSLSSDTNYATSSNDNNTITLFNGSSNGTNTIYSGLKFTVGALGGVIPGGEGTANIYAIRRGSNLPSTDLSFILKGGGVNENEMLERLRIKWNGRVGIGTSSPSYLLDVNGTLGVTGTATFSSSVTASSFIKSGGLSTEFLKANGTVDSNTYLTTSSASSTYLPLSGGTLSKTTTYPSSDTVLSNFYFRSGANNGVPIYGVLIDVAHHVANSAIGLQSTASTIYQTAIGLKGKAILNATGGNGAAYGVIGEIEAYAGGGNASNTYAGFFNNTSTVSDGNHYGLFVNTASGGDYGIYQTGTGVNFFGSSTTFSTDARSPIFYDSNNTAYYVDPASTSNLNSLTVGGNVGIGTVSPTSNLSFDGGAARTIGMERVTTSNTAGNNLTISASSATVSATDKNGGDVVISGGIATGTGSSRIVFRTATANFSTGTGDRTPSDKVIITGNGTIIQNGVSSTFVTGTCTANQTVNISFTTVTGGRLRVHAIITPTDGTSIGAQKMSVIGNSTGGISEVVISNTTTATIGSWTFSGSGTFFGVTKNAGSAATACTYLIEVMGNLA